MEERKRKRDTDKMKQKTNDLVLIEGNRGRMLFCESTNEYKLEE